MMESIQDQFVDVFSKMITSAVEALPRIFGGILLLLVALVLATILERVARAMLRRIRFDQMVRRSGVDRWLLRMGVRRSIDDIIPRVLFFGLILLFAREAGETVGLPAISDAIGALIAYFPRIIAAFLILLLGSIIAQAAGRTVRDAGRASGLEVANAMGNLTTGVIFFVLLVMALGQLEVDTSIVREFSTVLLAAAGLGLALSFGLGSRDITRNVLAGYYVRRAFPVGTEIEIHGHRGVVEAITPTQTLLREEGGTVVLPNAVFLDSTAGRPAN